MRSPKTPRAFFSFLVLAFAALPAMAPAMAQTTAQTSGASSEPQHNLEAFAPLDLPTPTSYRAADGRPGPAYWQQEVDYHIEVALDPATHRITGTETITYTNNSPLPLEALWVQLDQNLFNSQSRGAALQGADSRWRGAFDDGGYDITRVEVVQGDERQEANYFVDDTRMRILLERPVPPGGGTVDLDVDFAFTVPEYGADRMGRLDVAGGTVYEIAQWYPRMVVYDDVNGWNPQPYLGQGEFYLDYGDYDLEITVPPDFIVTATGELMNPDEVLTEEQQRRLARARESQVPVHVIFPDEVGRPETRPADVETLTWMFRAENVRDVAWAASPAFIWDAAGYENTLVQSFYPHEGLGDAQAPGWEEATRYGRHAIVHYSERWLPYPYPVATSVAGLVGGMEYPMIHFSSVQARGQALFGVIDHELGHNWFPMIVGSDERRHAWMDEGFTTFINYYSNLDYYGDAAERTGRVASARVAGRMQEPIADQPIATYPDRLRREGLGFLAYRKPAAGLILLREQILGPERFDMAFRAYADRWAFKHPQPADFFRTIEDVSGEDLDWFWRGWFFSQGVLDQAVAAVESAEEQTRITLENRGGLVMPAELEIRYATGTTERRRIPVEAWTTSDRHVEVIEGKRPLAEVRLDPDAVLPDVNRHNDRWTPQVRLTPQEPTRN